MAGDVLQRLAFDTTGQHGPVSYTHLDVYKRQDFGNAVFQIRVHRGDRQQRRRNEEANQHILRLSLIHI